MRFDVVTLFPEFFRSLTDCGITARARQRGLWSLQTWNPRDVTEDLHRTVDDRPFGGGPGMILMAEPLAQTVDAIRAAGNRGRVVSFAPNGRKLDDRRVREFVASGEDVVLICGRYEGIDERFLNRYVDEVISLGDFVLSGGELAAAALMDAVVRQLPGAIKGVPEVLLSGHHANIARWSREESLRFTLQTRPDLIKIANSSGLLSKADKAYLRRLDPKIVLS